MNIEEEIARVVDAGFDDYTPRYSEAGECVGSNVAAALMPLVRRAQAEALREVATGFIDWAVMYGHDPSTPKTDADHETADRLMKAADRIEQNSEGGET